jgi:hypothetical protein
MKPITITNPGSSTKLTNKQIRLLGIDPNADKVNGEMKTFGPWQMPINYKAICESMVFGDYSSVKEVTIYGYRTMYNVRQSGYCLEGWVSVQGKKRSCFTSDMLIETETGHLISVATIHARQC